MKKFLFNILFIDKIWGDKVSANKWLLPLSILTAAVMGIIFSGSSVFSSSFSNSELISIGFTLIIIWGFNLAESIIASDTSLTAFKRAALTLVLIVATFVLSCVASVVVIIIIALILMAVVLLAFASVALKTNFSSGGEKVELDNGDVVSKNGGLFGDGKYYSTTGSGKSYSSSSGTSFRED